MRDKQIDQFEAVFEQASIPVLHIPQLTVGRLSAVIKDNELDRTIVAMARYLFKRFEAKVHLHWTEAVGRQAARAIADREGFDVAPACFEDTDALVAQVREAAVQLALLPKPEDLSAPVIDLDRFVQALRAPILIIRAPITEPEAVFGNILHSLTGAFEQKRHFAYSFHLAIDGGRVFVLHSLAEHEIDEVREALQLSSMVTESIEADVLKQMAQRGERYLKGVVAGAASLPCQVSYRVQIGDAIDVVQAELATGDYSLLVIGAHAEGRSRVQAEVYQLMHQIQQVPVLAL